MDDDTSRTIQVVAGVFAVIIITVVGLTAEGPPPAEMLALVGSSFTIIASLLGVHYGIELVKQDGDDRDTD